MQNFDTKALKCVIIDNFDLRILKFEIDFVILGGFLRFIFSKHPRHRFACLWLDIVKIYKYAKFDPNIPCGSRFMSIYD